MIGKNLLAGRVEETKRVPIIFFCVILPLSEQHFPNDGRAAHFRPTVYGHVATPACINVHLAFHWNFKILNE